MHCRNDFFFISEKLRSLIVDGRIPEFNLMMSKSTIARGNRFSFVLKTQTLFHLSICLSFCEFFYVDCVH